MGGVRADEVEEGITLFRAGKYAEAEARLRGINGPEAGAYLPASLAKQKKYAEAEAPARAVLLESPMHAVAVAALGEALVGQKKYDDAIDRLSIALGKKDDLAYAYFWRGQAYDKKNQAAQDGRGLSGVPETRPQGTRSTRRAGRPGRAPLSPFRRTLLRRGRIARTPARS